jgi:hypothetical protein
MSGQLVVFRFLIIFETSVVVCLAGRAIGGEESRDVSTKVNVIWTGE